MKTITKCVVIENQEHYLVQVERSDFKEGKVMEDYVGLYGTIPYEWVDKNGRLNRKMTLLDILMSKTIKQAIENRMDIIKVSKMSESEMNEYFKNKFKAIKKKQFGGRE